MNALRKAGASVEIADTPFDLWVFWAGLWCPLECKSKGGRLTPRQKQKMKYYLDKHGYKVNVVDTPEAALRAVGII